MKDTALQREKNFERERTQRKREIEWKYLKTERNEGVTTLQDKKNENEKNINRHEIKKYEL
jgi:hypothetical protein